MTSRLLLIVTIVLLGGCRESQSTLSLSLTSPPSEQIRQYDLFQFDFRVEGVTGNPYDPSNVDVRLEVTTPGGKQLSQPAFFVQDHTIIQRDDRELVRGLGTSHWSVRWTPVEVGEYAWKLTASHRGSQVSQSGRLVCESGTKSGFVRISKTDSRYFETINGDFYYPIGHVTRSPDDARWRPLTFKNGVAVHGLYEDLSSLKIGKYERWFKRMHEAGENFCVIWMSPWWLGLEWSPTMPGYEGLGRYNQKHAAQLDRILQLAEEHEIKVLLFTSNHGRYSTAIDPQWWQNPHRKTDDGGLAESPTEFFKSDACTAYEKNRLRYILARWGYSTALLGIGLCTEVSWIDPYHGREAEMNAPVVDGTAKGSKPIHQDQALVVDWFRSMAHHVRSIDVHQHMVTLQFAKLEDGLDAWKHPEFDIVQNNAYHGQLISPSLTKPGYEPAEGVADGFLAWTRYVGNDAKPRLIAEWGGHHAHNFSECLATELRTGSWALSMSELSGVTGFWWCEEIDRGNHYAVFNAIQKFWGRYDRRGKRLKSQMLNVSFPIERPSVSGKSTTAFARHPTRRAIALANSDEAFIYVFHHHANTADVPISNELLYPIEEDAWVALPPSLGEGTFEVEFWDASNGEALGPPKLIKSRDGRIPLPAFRIDLAVKVRALR